MIFMYRMLHMFFLYILANLVFSKPVGHLVVVNGPIKVYVKSQEAKIDVFDMPYEIDSGVELRFEEDTLGQILLKNGSVLSVASNTQVVFENMVDANIMMKLRYGAVYSEEAPSMALSARGISAVSSGGSFIFKYNRSKLNGLFYSFSSNITVKHAWDGKNYAVKPMQVFSLYSYNSNKNFSAISDGVKTNAVSTFDFEYAPGGKVVASADLLKYDLSKDALPELKGNIDYIRRVVNIY